MCLISINLYFMEYLQGNPLTRFILNQCDGEERTQVLDWLNESEQNQATMRHFQQLLASAFAQEKFQMQAI